MFDEQVLALAERSAEAAEIFLHESSATPAEFHANKLKSLETKESRSITLRIINNGRIGVSSTTRTDDPESLVNDTLSSAQFGAEARFDFPQLGEQTPVDVFDTATPKFPVEKMVDTGQELIARLLDHNPDLLIDMSLAKEEEETRISRGGVTDSYKRTGFGISVTANLIRGTDMLDVFAFKASCAPDVDTDSLFTEITQKLELARNSSTLKSGTMPVVFTPIAFMLTMGPALGMGFSGKMVEQGASPLANRTGERVFDENLTIYDDATLDKRPRSSPFDDEGVPTRKVTLIDRGVVSEFLYDLQTAGKMGTQSTGNGYRGQGYPAPAATATIVDPGDGCLEEIIADIEEGLMVEYILGGGQANVLRGDFGGNVHLGFKIENGQLVGRIKDTLIAGNAYDVLADVRRIGGQPQWVGGSLYCPPIALEGVTVSTKES